MVKIQRIKNKDYKPGKETLIGAGAGLGTGAIITRGTAAVAITMGTFGLAAPLIPAMVATGRGIGTAVGGSAGYAVDVYNQGKKLYQFTVKPAAKKDDILVVQYMQQNIQPGDEVRLYLKKDGRVVLKKLREDRFNHRE